MSLQAVKECRLSKGGVRGTISEMKRQNHRD